MASNRWTRWVDGLEDRGRRVARRAGRWAGRALPEWGRRLEALGASLGADPGTEPAAPQPVVVSEGEAVLDLEGLMELEDLDFEVDDGSVPRMHTGTDVLPDLEIPTEGSLDERLEVFAESVRGATGAYAAFVADAQGLPLVSRHGSDDQIAITAALDRALAPIRESLQGSPQGSVAVEIDRSNVLQVIWLNTESGRYVVGLVLPQSLGGDLIESIRARLLPLFSDSKDDAA